jgi:hypothetical protein
LNFQAGKIDFIDFSIKYLKDKDFRMLSSFAKLRRDAPLCNATGGTHALWLRSIFAGGDLVDWCVKDMQRVEKYRQRAAELRELANEMKDPQARDSLFLLAASYDSMAVNLKGLDQKLEPN